LIFLFINLPHPNLKDHEKNHPDFVNYNLVNKPICSGGYHRSI
jgi:hypothetical protein